MERNRGSAIINILNVAWIGVLVLVVGSMFEVASVQRKAAPCDRVIRVAESFNLHAGRYPKSEEMTALEPELSALCGYRPAQESFLLVVSGHWFNLQAYDYDSRRKLWRWD